MKNRFNQFTLLINNISRNIRKIKTEEVKEYNLKGPHVSCLYYLYKESSLTVKELKEICNEDKAAISRTLDYLEVNGFLTYEISDNKKYKAHLYLTEKGQRVGKLISNKIDKFLEEASLGLTDEDRQVLYKSLEKINDNLNRLLNNKRK